jgi:hypothetical protein
MYAAGARLSRLHGQPRSTSRMTVAEAALKDAHTGSIMDSYNLAYVQHLTQNGRLDIDVAKQEREMLHRRAHAGLAFPRIVLGSLNP